MNIARNMEAVFIAAIAIAGVTAFATKPAMPRHPVVQTTSTEQAMVITHVGKRLTSAEKAEFDAQS
jgi:hypothetical protein